MIDNKYKMVVVETPEADRILKNTGLKLGQLKTALIKTVGSSRVPAMVMREQIFEMTGVMLSKRDAGMLVNIAMHFGAKAIIGSDHYQEKGKVMKNGRQTKIKPNLKGLKK